MVSIALATKTSEGHHWIDYLKIKQMFCWNYIVYQWWTKISGLHM